MTKSELINAVHDKATAAGIELTKKATGEVLDLAFEVISAAINEHDRFSYPQFGTFSVKKRAEREGRNPRTGKPIKIEASKTVSFKPAPSLKEKLS